MVAEWGADWWVCILSMEYWPMGGVLGNEKLGIPFVLE
jgi:hypothetical protein